MVEDFRPTALPLPTLPPPGGIFPSLQRNALLWARGWRGPITRIFTASWALLCEPRAGDAGWELSGLGHRCLDVSGGYSQ